MIAYLRQRLSEDRGSMSLGAAATVPALFLIGAILLMAGRLALAEGSVQSAANEAARAASISRTQAIAGAQASSTAASTLANANLKCSSTNVATDLSAFNQPVGQVGTVTVTVTCVVPLADLAIPGVGGTRTITSTGTSVIDAYRERA